MVNLLAASATALVASFLVALAQRRKSLPRTESRSPRRRSVPGLDVSASRFWAMVAVVAALTYAVVYALTGLIVVAVVPALVVATLPRAYYARRHSRRLAEVQESWPDGLRDVLSSVGSGSSLPNAIENLAAFGPEPLRNAFQGFDIYSRSLGVVAALELVREDLADPTTDRIIEVLILAYEKGGAVVPEILSDLADATTRDLRTLEEIRTEALEQKINSRIVFVLPWLVLVAITSQSGAFRDFYSTPAGVTVAVIGGVMSLFGMFVASRLGGQPSEPRVIGEPE